MLGVTLPTLALAAAALYAGARAYLFAELDRQLARTAGLVAAAVEMEGNELDLVFEERLTQPDAAALPIEALTVRLGGQTLMVWPDQAPTAALLQAGDELKHGETTAAHHPDGQPCRLIAWRWHDPTEAPHEPGDANAADVPFSLTLAVDASSVHDLLSRLVLALVSVGALAAVSIAAALSFALPRALRPVAELSASLERRAEAQLTEPLDDGQVPAELRPLVTQFNALLRRVANTIEQQRLFSANAAHELRNPLAALRMTLDVQRARNPNGDERTRTALDRAHHITLQMQELVEALLALARLDPPETGRDAAPGTDKNNANHHAAATPTHDLGRLVTHVWEQLHPDPHNFQLQSDLPPGVHVRADPALLNVAVRNLLRNAADYVKPDGTISLDLRAHDGHARLHIANDAEPLEPHALDALFTPLWRHDPSQGHGEHFGLGLPLARKAAERLGGTLTATQPNPGRFEAVLQLPLADHLAPPASTRLDACAS